MSQNLGKVAADFTSQLAVKISVGATTGSLESNVDDDGNVLANGQYFFALDGDSSLKEHIQCTLTGLNLTNIQSVSRQGVLTAGVVREHRVGATVTLTDFADLFFIVQLLTGAALFDHTTPLSYDGTASITLPNQFATKAYVDGVAVSGAPNADASTKGIVQEATTAQINAGTDTGSTGAKLFASPADLAASIYGLQLPTANQKLALVGNNTDIAVGSTNKYMTQTGTQKQAESSATTTGSVNTYLATLNPQPISYGNLLLKLKANFTNTAAAFLNIGIPTSLGTATITIATPAVITFNAHGLVAGDMVRFTTSGALPTGITASTDYYVIAGGLTTNAFEISATNGGSAINTTGSQSGTHTLFRMTRNITKQGSVAVAPGEIANGSVFQVYDDGTNLQLQTPSAITALNPKAGSVFCSVTGSGSQTIAHGLGRVPSFGEFRVDDLTFGTYWNSAGTYDGTNQQSSGQINTGSSGSTPTTQTIDAAHAIHYTPITGLSVVGTVAWDATNITITFTGGRTSALIIWKVA